MAVEATAQDLATIAHWIADVPGSENVSATVTLMCIEATNVFCESIGFPHLSRNGSGETGGIDVANWPSTSER